MIEEIRKIVNYDSYENKTKRLLELREEVLKSSSVKRFFKLRKYNKMLQFFSCDIPIETKIGKGLVLPHGGNGIFISRGACIGENCTIFQQVTIGSNTLKESKNKGVPVIGNNVYIGAGAKIIGNVIVGDNVRIGANAIVTLDIHSNATVVMNHPRVIIKEQSNNKFVSY